MSAAAWLADKMREAARHMGFDLVGITTPEPTDHAGFYRHWLDAGCHGEMAYLARPDAVARRADLRGTLEGVRSVVVVAHNYFQPDPEGVPDDPSRGTIARYARGRDYHRVVKGKLVALGRWLEGAAGTGSAGEAGVGGAAARGAPSRPVSWRAYVDTGPILERDLGRRAGLGWLGKNTMLLHPRTGSYFFLGVLLTDAELTPDAPFEADHCGTCRACLDACPTGALLGRDESGAPVMDARRCISYLTIEHRGPIPRELRPLMGNRVFGCDICQEVCPWNNDRFVQLTGERGYRPDWREAADRPAVAPELPGTEGPSLLELMRMSREEWDLWTRGSAIRRAGYAGFKRNVAVAMGNWLASVDEPPEEAVAVLRDALEDEEPLVREHAAWALERAG